MSTFESGLGAGKMIGPCALVLAKGERAGRWSPMIPSSQPEHRGPPRSGHELAL